MFSPNGYITVHQAFREYYESIIGEIDKACSDSSHSRHEEFKNKNIDYWYSFRAKIEKIFFDHFKYNLSLILASGKVVNLDKNSMFDNFYFPSLQIIDADILKAYGGNTEKSQLARSAVNAQYESLEDQRAELTTGPPEAFLYASSRDTLDCMDRLPTFYERNYYTYSLISLEIIVKLGAINKVLQSDVRKAQACQPLIEKFESLVNCPIVIEDNIYKKRRKSLPTVEDDNSASSTHTIADETAALKAGRQILENDINKEYRVAKLKAEIAPSMGANAWRRVIEKLREEYPHISRRGAPKKSNT